MYSTECVVERSLSQVVSQECEGVPYQGVGSPSIQELRELLDGGCPGGPDGRQRPRVSHDQL